MERSEPQYVPDTEAQGRVHTSAAGVLVRHDHRQVPPKVDYALTPFGMTLVEALMPLCDWGTRNRSKIAEIMPSRPQNVAAA